jgi:hypothetical protein
MNSRPLIDYLAPVKDAARYHFSMRIAALSQAIAASQTPHSTGGRYGSSDSLAAGGSQRAFRSDSYPPIPDEPCCISEIVWAVPTVLSRCSNCVVPNDAPLDHLAGSQRQVRFRQNPTMRTSTITGGSRVEALRLRVLVARWRPASSTDAPPLRPMMSLLQEGTHGPGTPPQVQVPPEVISPGRV